MACAQACLSILTQRWSFLTQELGSWKLPCALLLFAYRYR